MRAVVAGSRCPHRYGAIVRCCDEKTTQNHRSWVAGAISGEAIDATAITNTTRGGRRARHPKTTLPHRPPGLLAADRIVGGSPRAPARSGGG
eukprot:scaffold8207_cov22-Phaeocystis_antarctica.AAC.1